MTDAHAPLYEPRHPWTVALAELIYEHRDGGHEKHVPWAHTYPAQQYALMAGADGMLDIFRHFAHQLQSERGLDGVLEFILGPHGPAAAAVPAVLVPDPSGEKAGVR